jgi:hypothetical protein
MSDRLEAIRRDHEHQRTPTHVDRLWLIEEVDRLEATVQRVRDLVTSMEWRRPAKSPCEAPELCCGSESSCDAMQPVVRVIDSKGILAALDGEGAGK